MIDSSVSESQRFSVFNVELPPSTFAPPAVDIPPLDRRDFHRACDRLQAKIDILKAAIRHKKRLIGEPAIFPPQIGGACK
jgi:hypothetical protein